MADDWKDRIFAEKSLWEVYKLSRRVLPRPKANDYIFWGFAAILVGLFGWLLIGGSGIFGEQDALAFLRYCAAQGMSLAIGILGFLIAGFAIFASVTRAELFITLASIPYKKAGKETGINRLQFVFFNFINVFTVYIGLLALCMLVAIGLSENSPIIKIAASVPPSCLVSPLLILLGLTGALILWLVAALLKLKSFIWNLYQTVLVAIATEAEIAALKREG